MEGALQEDLAEQETEQLACERIAVGTVVDELRAGVSHADAVETLEDEETPARHVVVHRWDEHGRMWGRGSGDGSDVACLDPEVEFLGDRVGEGASDIFDVVAGGPIGLYLEAAGDAADRVEVTGDELVDAGTLHLQHHSGAIVETGAVCLRQRGARQRLGIDRGEDLARLGPELLFEHRLDLPPRCRRNVVLQLGELGGDCHR